MKRALSSVNPEFFFYVSLLPVLLLKLLHKLNQFLRTCQVHGVVNGGAHAVDLLRAHLKITTPSTPPPPSKWTAAER